MKIYSYVLMSQNRDTKKYFKKNKKILKNLLTNHSGYVIINTEKNRAERSKREVHKNENNV